MDSGFIDSELKNDTTFEGNLPSHGEKCHAVITMQHSNDYITL